MSDNNSFSRSWNYRLLWAIVLISLLFSAVLLVGLIDFRIKAGRQVEAAAGFLKKVEIADFDLPVHVDETLTISMTVAFSDTFAVPISHTIPISLTVPFQEVVLVPINTTIPINAGVNVPVDLPVVGRINVPFPITTNFPVNLTVEVPISETIPVEAEIPIELMVAVPIESDIPIETEVPVQLDFPVTIPMDEMGFQELLQLVQEALDLLLELLGQSQN